MSYTSEVSADSKKLIDDFDNFSYSPPFAPNIQRSFNISLIVPDDDSLTEAPLIIWSHGGNKGAAPGELKKTSWARFLAQAGYIVAMISHTRPEENDLETAIRNHLGLAGESDSPDVSFKSLNYLRLLDIQHLVGQIDSINRHLAAKDQVQIDTSKRYALAGHAEGADAVITFAGAKRYWHEDDSVGTNYSLKQLGAKEPGLYLCLSPAPADGHDHFKPGSWQSVGNTLPVLIVTGKGDITGDVDDAEARRQCYREMTEAGGSNKYLLWIDDDEPDHHFYNHTGSTVRDFEEYADNIRSVGIAFLDKYIHDSTDADEYLCQGGLKTDLAPDVVWEFK